MKFIYDNTRNNIKIHCSSDDNILLCSGKKPSHPLLWSEYGNPVEVTSYFHTLGNWACRKCLAKMYSDKSLGKN